MVFCHHLWSQKQGLEIRSHGKKNKDLKYEVTPKKLPVYAMSYVSIFPDPPHSQVADVSRILQELTRFVPQLPPNDATGMAAGAALSAVGGQMLPIVQDGPARFMKLFSVAFVKVGLVREDMSTMFNVRFPSVFIQFSFDFTRCSLNNSEAA